MSIIKGYSEKRCILFLVICTAIMFFSAAKVYAEDPLTLYTANPLINVTYGEDPVTVLYYNLTHKDTGMLQAVKPVISTTPLVGVEFLFRTEYLLNGEYTFFIRAKDVDDNIVEKSQDFMIEHEGFKVWLISPPVGIGQTNPYDIAVGTQVNAFCKWGENVNYAGCDDDDIKCLFERLRYPYNLTDNRKEHTITNLFTNPAPYAGIKTICRLNASIVPEDPQSYGILLFRIGHDFSNPRIISNTSIPNPIEDGNDISTNITVITDEPAVCKIYRNSNTFLSANIDRFFDSEDRLIYSDYRTEHNAFIRYTPSSSVPNQISLAYTITCYDYSQRTAVSTFIQEINLNSNIVISLIEPQLYSSPPPDAYANGESGFIIRTNVQAQQCSMKFNNDPTKLMIKDSGSNYRWKYNDQSGPLQWVDGKNNITVVCSGLGSYTKRYEILYDDEPPVMNDIDIRSHTCGLDDGFTFVLNASDGASGIRHYIYKVERRDANGQTVLVKDWTRVDFTGRITLIKYLDDGLIENNTYIVTAYATDGAGLNSTEKSGSIIAKTESAVYCDEISPSIKLTFTSLSPTGNYVVKVTVNCTDNPGGSGCEDYFKYAVVNSTGADCSLIGPDEWAQSDFEPLIYTPEDYAEFTFCAKVFDKNRNQNSTHKSTTLDRPICGNNIVENINIQGEGFSYTHPEICDGTAFNGLTCGNFGEPVNYSGGYLICINDCQTISTDNCDDGLGYCGDGKLNQFRGSAGNEEQCDGNVPSNRTWGNIRNCSQFGFAGGELRCNPPSASLEDMCKFNTSECTVSGNPLTGCGGPQGMMNPGEQCEPDRRSLWKVNCSDFDNFTSGEIECYPFGHANACMFDIDACEPAEPPPECGDDVIEWPEECEVGDTLECENPPYTTGTKICINSTCTWDDQRCGLIPKCGDGIVQQPNGFNVYEQCDLDNFTFEGYTLTCKDFGGSPGYPRGILRCDPDTCQADTSNCDKGSGYCGDGGINQSSQGSNPEQCDGNLNDAKHDWGGIARCQDFGFTGGKLTCNPPSSAFEDMCKFNTSQCQSPYGRGTCGIGNNPLLNINEQCDGDTAPLLCDDFDSFGGGDISCDSGCRYDIDGCTPPLPPPKCGNNIKEAGEDCDGTEIPITQCTEYGNYSAGTLSCFPPNSTHQCEYNASLCEIPLPDVACGDGIVQESNDEQCDGMNFTVNGVTVTCASFGFEKGGIMQCTPPGPGDECKWNTDNCDQGGGFCGNNKIDNLLYEQCDGPFQTVASWGNIRTCQDFNFSGGALGCRNYSSGRDLRCTFDTSKCIPRVQNNNPTCDAGSGTSTTTLDKGEQCELTRNPFALDCLDFDSFDGGNISCSDSCFYNIRQCTFVYNATCSNGIVEPGEQCEGNMTRACGSFTGYLNTGFAFCNPDTCVYDDFSECIPEPVCGNNRAEGWEICDGTDLGGLKCTDLQGPLGPYVGGKLGCFDNESDAPCTLNTFGCDAGYGYCGDGMINNTPNEQCDGNENISTLNWGQVRNCTDFGFLRGDLRCGDDCKFDTSRCISNRPTGSCEDPHLNPGEQCSPNRAFSMTCKSFDHFNNGTLECGSDCIFDISGCFRVNSPFCGNGVIDVGEHCDGEQMGEMTLCSDINESWTGELSCYAPETLHECNYDPTGCNVGIDEGYCGDGIRNGEEKCDGNDLGDVVCTDIDNFTGGNLSCHPPGSQDECTFNKKKCDRGFGWCGDGFINNWPNEQCDGSNWGYVVKNCTAFGFTSGTLSCNDDCIFNTERCTKNAPPMDCGDDILSPGEQCDGTYQSKVNCTYFDSLNSGTVSCDPATCIFNIEGCAITPDPYCGDGIIHPGETCDGNALGQTNLCAELDPERYISGLLRCYPRGNANQCLLDTSGCVEIGNATEYCGDGLINNFPNEECDGSNLANSDCIDMGFSGGILRCNAPNTSRQCQFNTSACIGIPGGFCGDGNLNPGEDCERSVPLEMTCYDIDNFQGGDLGCFANCTFNISGCIPPEQPGVCGDGIRNNYEQCDGNDVPLGCTDIDNFTGGILGCNEDCTFAVQNCDRGFGYCGDNKVNNFPLEQCDGSTPSQATWGNIRNCTQFGFTNGTLSCGNDCLFDTSLCTNNVLSGYCGDSILFRGEQCDVNRPLTLKCSDFDHLVVGGVSCNDCIYDISECRIPAQPSCGNSIIEQGETCDGQNLGGESCNSLGYVGGVLRCHAAGQANACLLDTSQCDDGGETEVCGDGVATGIEQCDTNDLGVVNGCSDINGFVGGILKCYPLGTAKACMWNTEYCDLGHGYCGDGIINNFPDEQCDGSEWGGITGCSDLGFQGTGLRCDGCRFNTSACTGSTGGYCGDDVLNVGEQCEATKLPFNATCTDFDSFIGGTLNCVLCQYELSDCELPTMSVCGDGIISGLEQCDLNNLGTKDECTDFDNGFVSGYVSCNPPGDVRECQYDLTNCELPENGTICGDGVRNDGEQCDGSDLGIICSDLDRFKGGILSCFKPNTPSQCMWDSSNCDDGDGYCGDGIINNFPDEQCDGNAWGRIFNCSDFGFQGGTLRCNAKGTPMQCRFNTAGCIGYPGGFCGDNVTNVGEQCEANRPFSATCTDFDSFIGGTLNCINCQYELSDCDPPTVDVCGDQLITGLEECDGTNLNGFKCEDIDDEFIGGTLRCYPKNSARECQYNLSSCISLDRGYCGDNVTNNFPNEECDGNFWGDITGCQDLGFLGGNLTCSACSFNTSRCISYFNGTGFCGDKRINTGEKCEPEVPLDVTCEDLGFAGGTLKCYANGTNACSFDITSCQPELPDSVCGDGNATGLELCDGTDLRGVLCSDIDDFVGGILKCNPANSDDACFWNTDNCDGGSGYCGDNRINSFPNEQCDGTDWGTVKNCKDFGFTGGVLTCNPASSSIQDMCRFNTSKCTARVTVGVCGDRTLNPGEECDLDVKLPFNCTRFDSFTGGSLSCNYETCMFDISQCIMPTRSVCGDGKKTGTEQCDGKDLGNMLKCTDINSTRFLSGNVNCTSKCGFDLRGCEIAPVRATCNNGIIETGEQCDSELIVMECTDFDLANGVLACTENCSADTSGCVNPITLPPECGNGRLEPGENCDGNVSSTMAQLYSCMFGAVCTDACDIECAVPGENQECYNNETDEDETDTDCGGSCPKCEIGMKCTSGSDCKSASCTDGLCTVNHCTNGEMDVGESAVDCGGDCEQCAVGLTCNSDNDCISLSCKEGVCVENVVLEEKNPLGLMLVLIGVVMVLGGAGYVVYITYFAKKPVRYEASNVSSYVQAEMPMKKSAPPPEQTLFQQKKFEHKVALDTQKRKNILQGFDENASELDKIKERNAESDRKPEAAGKKQDEKEDVVQQDKDGFVSIDDLKSKSSKESAISKLVNIINPQAGNDAARDAEDKEKNEKQDMQDDSSRAEPGAVQKTADLENFKEKIARKSLKKAKGREIKSSKKKDENQTFKELKQVTSEDAASKISQISGKSESSDLKSIKEILKSESVSPEDAAKLFEGVDREKFLSDEFKDVALALIDTGKISKDTLYSFIFENIEKGILSKRDAAKILSGLKLI